MNIWDFQKQTTQRLLAVNLLNMACGAWLQRGDPFLRGVGTQAVGWASINMAIAAIGNQVAKRREKQLSLAGKLPAAEYSEQRSFRRLLLVNTLLDVVYMVGGWKWAQHSDAYSYRRGNAIGIVLQGGLLFVFDLIHVVILPNRRTTR